MQEIEVRRRLACEKGRIANDLDISPRTVEVYRANLMTKMQASGLSQLVRMALIGGLSEPDL